MATLTLKPLLYISSSNANSTDISLLRENPDNSADSSYITCNTQGAWNIRFSLDNPISPPNSDLKIRANLDNIANALNAYITLWQNGIDITPSTGVLTTGYNEIIVPLSNLVDPSGQGLEITYNGGKNNTNNLTTSLYALDVQYTAQSTTVAPNLPTNLTPVSGYIPNGQTVTFSATLNDAEPTSDTVKLVVEYSTDQTFASGVTTVTSTGVAPSSTDTVQSNKIFTNGTYYWRAYALDSGGLKSSYTATRSFTITNSSDPVVISRTPSNNANPSTPSQTLSAVGIDANGNNVKLQFQVSADSSFATFTQYDTSYNTSNSTFQVTANLVDGANYWRVRAINSLGVTSIWTNYWLIFYSAPSTGTLQPDAVLTATNLTGANLGTINDDPDAPDAVFATPTSSASAVTLRVSFPTPPRSLRTGAGLQTFKMWVKRGTSGSTSNPTATMKVYEGGTLKATGTANTVNTSTGQLFSYNWDASVLSALNGSNVELQIDGTTIGSGGSRTSVAIGAVEWNYNLSLAFPISIGDDTTAPASVSNLSATSTNNTVTLNWTNPSDADHSYMEIYRDNVLIKNYFKGTSFTDFSLNASTSYQYKIICVDTVGNKSTPNTYTIATTAPSSSTPVVTIVSIAKTKISNKTGANISTVTFTFDTDVTAWTVNVLGSSYNTGTVADSGGTVTKGTQINAYIDNTELYQEGDNRINIYGQNASGWTPYAG